MIWSISYHFNVSEIDSNVQNACGSISKFAGFSLNFRWYSRDHFEVLSQARIVFHPQVLKSTKVESHSQPEFQADQTVRNKQQHIHILQIVIDHQSDQLKNRKFYEKFSEYAKFSKSSHKGHKTKGQILIHSQGGLWTRVYEILVFTSISSTCCIARTLD